MVQQIVVKVIGLKKVRRNIGKIRRRTPKVLGRGAEDLAREIQRRARISFSQQFDRRTHRAVESIQAQKVRGRNPYSWRVIAGPLGAREYILRLEEKRPIEGYRFIPRPGAGFWGEGYSRPGGRIKEPRQKGRFMRTAFKSVEKDSKKRIEARVNNMIKRSGF